MLSRIGGVEQHAVLQDDADLATQPRGIDLGHVDAVDQHAPALGNVEALHQLRQRALAGSGGAHNSNDLAGWHVHDSRRARISGPSSR